MAGLARFVESLLRGRSPEPCRLDAEEAEAARAAIELSRSRDEAHAPDPAFVERLRDRLAADLSGDPDPAEPDCGAEPVRNRAPSPPLPDPHVGSAPRSRRAHPSPAADPGPGAAVRPRT